MAGAATELANPVIGTSAPAPPHFARRGYTPVPVRITLMRIRIRDVQLLHSSFVGSQLLHLTVVIDDLPEEADRSAEEESLEHIEPHIVPRCFLFDIVFILFLLFHALYFIHDESLLLHRFVERCSD